LKEDEAEKQEQKNGEQRNGGADKDRKIKG
jgi:hypothetical protein